MKEEAYITVSTNSKEEASSPLSPAGGKRL